MRAEREIVRGAYVFDAELLGGLRWLGLADAGVKWGVGVSGARG